MRQLLYDERPLVVNPTLAATVGLTEAIILQQVHYWAVLNEEAGRNLKDGSYWTYNTYREWQEQLPFWSEGTIKRAVLNLEKQGLLISARFNGNGFDKTKWYRVNYKALTAIAQNALSHTTAEQSTATAEIVPSDGANCADDGGKLRRPISADCADRTAQIAPTNTIEYPDNTPQKVTSENNVLPGVAVKPEKTKRVKTVERDSVIHGMFEVMRRYLGYPEKTDKDPIPNYGVEGKAMKRLLMRGFTAPEILDYWKKRVDARKGFISMVYVNQDIGGPATGGRMGAGRTPVVSKHYNLPGETELERQAREKGITI